MLRKAISASALILLGACGAEMGEPYYPHDECRRIDLIDPVTDATVIGAEDIVFDEAGGRLIVSAYDRRAAEKAAKQSSVPPPQGGLYAVPIDGVFRATNSLAATRLADPTKIKNGLRPHGVDAANGEIVFVNRGYVQDGKRWRMIPAMVRVMADGEIASKRTHCAANDVAVYGDGHLLTRDHLACGGFSRMVENVFAQKKSGAYFDDGGALIDGVAFANGVTVLNNGFAVAATREKTVHIFISTKGEGSRQFEADTPGAPDNLSVASDGHVIAALHPNLLRLALARKLDIGKSGSRIIRIDTNSGETELLFDDPAAALFSAATIGVSTDRGLVAGSVLDRGLLVCEKR